MSRNCRLVLVLAGCAQLAESIRFRRRSGTGNFTVEYPGQEETKFDVANLGGGEDSDRCSISVSYWTSHMRFPLAQTGWAAIGGCGGTGYNMRQYGKNVKQISMWSSRRRNRAIKSIRVTYNDYATQSAGNPSGGEDAKSWEFQVGEFVRGDMTITSNGVGSRAGSLKFKTSLDRDYSYVATDAKNKYFFPSNDAFMAGFLGKHGSDIDSLGVYMWKPLRAVYYKSMTYPTLDQQIAVTAPTEVAARNYCNAYSDTFPASKEKYRTEVTEGRQSCFSSTVGTQFGVDIKAKGGFPVLGEGEVTKKWEISASATYENCKETSETKERTLEYPALMMKPFTSVRYEFTQWQGVLSQLPFRATVEFEFTDRSTFQRTESGTYAGVHYTRVDENVCCERRVSGDDCKQ